MSERSPVHGRRRGEEGAEGGKGKMIMDLERRKCYPGTLLDPA